MVLQYNELVKKLIFYHESELKYVIPKNYLIQAPKSYGNGRSVSVKVWLSNNGQTQFLLPPFPANCLLKVNIRTRCGI